MRILFVLWIVAVAALSVISYPGSKDLLMIVKLTSSGFVVHGVACFVGVLLCFLAFEKKEDGDQMTEQGDLSQGMIAFGKDDSLREGWMDGKCGIITAGMDDSLREGWMDGKNGMIPSGLDGKGKAEDGGRRSKFTFIWMSGLLIFLFGVVLEVVQFYLPYRTFNVYDVVGNGVGILALVFIWVMIYGKMQRGNVT